MSNPLNLYNQNTIIKFALVFLSDRYIPWKYKYYEPIHMYESWKSKVQAWMFQALSASHQLTYSCWLYDLRENAQVPCDLLTQPHKVESNPRSSNNVWIQSPEWAWEYESDQTQAHTCHYRHLTCWHVCMVSTVSKQHILQLNQNWLSLTLILDLEVSSKSNVQPNSTEKVESNLVTWPDMVKYMSPNEQCPLNTKRLLSIQSPCIKQLLNSVPSGWATSPEDYHAQD